MPVALGHPPGEHGAEAAVVVADGDLDPHRPTRLQCRTGLPDQLVVEGLGQAVILSLAVVGRDPGSGRRQVEQPREVETLGLPVTHCPAHVDEIGAADHVAEAAEAEPRHQATDLFGHEEEVVDHMFRLAREALAQLRVLGGHTHGAGIEVALAHHDAAGHDQRGRRKAELVGPQQGADDHVAPGAQAAVHLHRDTPAQPVQHQGLVGLGQPDLPGRAGVLDGRVWWVSASPISHGEPACLMEVSGEAPVPPS